MSLPHLVLGALSVKPLSGYAMDKLFQQSVVHFWTTDRSQIYRALHRLEKQGWASMEQIAQENLPDRKVYHITEAGMAELRRWLRTPLSLNDAPVREGWLGQVFYGEHVSRADLLDVLRAYHANALDAVGTLSALRDGINAQSRASLGAAPMPERYRLQLLTLDYGIVIQQALADWIAHAIAEIESWPGSSDARGATGDNDGA